MNKEEVTSSQFEDCDEKGEDPVELSIKDETRGKCPIPPSSGKVDKIVFYKHGTLAIQV